MLASEDLVGKTISMTTLNGPWDGETSHGVVKAQIQFEVNGQAMVIMAVIQSQESDRNWYCLLKGEIIKGLGGRLMMPPTMVRLEDPYFTRVTWNVV